MLGLGDNSTPQPAADLIRDGSDATFMAEVIEASREVPVIVDFWAPWCGPCRSLTPAIEGAVTAARGKVRLVKINVDENPQIAAQLRIQSIPTVYAFWQGQPVDGFQGALPGSEVAAFIERVGALAGDGGLAEALEAAEAMLTEGAAADAAQTFAAILAEDPESAAAYGGLVRAQISAGQIEEAEQMLAAVPASLAAAPEVDSARAQLALAHQARNAGPIAQLSAAVEADPDDHQSRLDLAKALYAKGDAQAAVDQLLELFRRDREWNDGAAKSQLFIIFDALKPQDPIALSARRKLSSMIFA